MSKYILVLISILISLSTVAQEHKQLTKEKKTCNCSITPSETYKGEISQQTMEKSINEYDWSNFRLENKKRVITFDNGYQITLNSKEEIENSTVNSTVETNLDNIKNAHYKATFDKYGNVMMLIPNANAKSKIKNANN